MNRFFLRALALGLLIVVALAPVAPLKAMDAQADTHEGPSFVAKIGLAALVPTAGYMYLLRKHYTTLHAIERQLDLSTIAQSARDTHFRFATWRSTHDNASDEKVWVAAHDICFESEQVVKTLLHDAKKCPDRVFIYDITGIRCEPNKVTNQALKEAISREKQLFEEELAIVAQFTNAPDLITKALAPEDSRCLTAHELALTCASKLKEDKAEVMQTVQDQITAAGRLQEVVYFGGWLPTSWSFAPCYQKASRVYLKLFKAYARLCALDAAINAE